MRLAQAFVPWVPALDEGVAQALRDLAARDPDERIAMSEAHALLEGAIAYAGDPALGLKAGRALSLGDGGALDYAMHALTTVQEAIEVAHRYIRLLNDALEIGIEIDGERAIVRLDSHVVLPRAAEDFMMSSLFAIHMRRLVLGASELECWLSQPAPGDTTEHARTFGSAQLRFGAPYCAFVFERKWLQAPLASADFKLYAVLHKQVERALSELPRVLSFTETVRRLIADRLSRGHPTAATVASALGMSPRTLSRRLSQEGTSFGPVLEELRRRLAFSYLGQAQIGIAEVAFLLGFSQPEAFHRAFRRWTGQTPREYRRAHRR
jgi:AraC-like DNA-binding protein